MSGISRRFRARSRMAKTAVLSALAPFIWSSHALAQAPQQNASFVPVALWVVGVVILGVAIAWGILHNRRRTRRERQITEQATRESYSGEARDRANAPSRR